MRSLMSMLALLLLVGCAEKESGSVPVTSTVSPKEVYENPVDQKTYVAPGG